MLGLNISILGLFLIGKWQSSDAAANSVIEGLFVVVPFFSYRRD